MKPSVSRMVHYVSYGTPGGEYLPECRAAVIAEVHDDDLVELCVLNPKGIFFTSSTYHGSEDFTVHNADGEVIIENHVAPYGGTWHWPERVDD